MMAPAIGLSIIFLMIIGPFAYAHSNPDVPPNYRRGLRRVLIGLAIVSGILLLSGVACLLSGTISQWYWIFMVVITLGTAWSFWLPVVRRPANHI